MIERLTVNVTHSAGLFSRLFFKRAGWIFLMSLLWHFPSSVYAQQDSLPDKLTYEADFRFRLEQDWDVRNPDGSYKEDRGRMRYRARVGLIYNHNSWSEFGLRLRTGDPNKQQDPQITLGDQFSGIPVSLERAYAAFNIDKFSAWVGKNTFPFEKQNELFWSDNVFPEGITVGWKTPISNSFLDGLELKGGHFIFATNGAGFGRDSYFQGFQLLSQWNKGQFLLFPAIYIFKQMPDIPDGNETFKLDYTIAHLGSRYRISDRAHWYVELDYYHNLENLGRYDSVPSAFRDQKKGLTISTRLGNLDKRNNWLFRISYNYQERYAAVDYLSQNDWARWDYSEFGSPDGRLTNYEGVEILVAYALTNKLDLQLRSFFVEQLVPTGIFTETNSRVRFDINIKI